MANKIIHWNFNRYALVIGITLLVAYPLLVRAQSQPPADQQEQKNILELPEFIIKGAGTLDIAGAHKMRGAQDWSLDSNRLAALHPVTEALLPPPSIDSLRSSSAQATNNFLAHVQLGTYGTPFGWLRYQTIAAPFDLYVRGDAVSTNGSAPEAQATFYGVNAGAGWHVPENVEYFANARVGVDLDLHNGTYDLYGTPTPTLQRQTYNAGMAISAAQEAGALQFNAALLSRGYKAQDSLVTIDNLFGLQGGIRYINNNWLLNANVQFKNYSGSTTRNFSELSFGAQHVGGLFRYSIGASLYTAQNRLFDMETFVTPVAQAQLAMTNSVQLFARFAPQMQDETMAGVMAVNPYMNLAALDSIKYPYQPINLSAGIRAQGTELSGELSVHYVRTNDDRIFILEPMNQWNLDYETTNLFAVQVEGAWQMTVNDNIMCMIIGRSNTVASTGNPVPYIAPVVANIGYSHIFAIPLTLGGTLDILGARNATLDGTQSLPTVALLNAHAEYRFSDHISLTAQLENILNQSYAIWNGYTATKIFIAGGVTAAF